MEGEDRLMTDTSVAPARFSERLPAFGTVYRAARRGDPHAMRVLVATYDPMVLRYFASVDIAHPDAAAAHVWSLYTRTFRRVRNERDFAVKLFELAHDVAVAILAEHAGDVHTPVYDEAGAAARLLSTLPFPEAEVLALLVVVGFDDHEIAAATRRPLDEVAHLSASARSNLRDLLGR